MNSPPDKPFIARPRLSEHGNGRAMSRTIPTHSDATGALPHAGAHTGAGFWTLTLGSIGVVYGDIGTSPLYALRESLASATRHAGHSTLTREMVFGVVSLILWALIIIVTIKYVVLVMSADNKGEGGTLSLITRRTTSTSSCRRPACVRRTSPRRPPRAAAAVRPRRRSMPAASMMPGRRKPPVRAAAAAPRSRALCRLQSSCDGGQTRDSVSDAERNQHLPNRPTPIFW
jgi:hypothetical protein